MLNKISLLEEVVDLLKDKMHHQHRLSRIWFHYAIEELENYLDSQKQFYYQLYDEDDDLYDKRREDQLALDYC